ncbi:MAG: hypothetical protein Q8L48_18620 [Archangium sp.]|nr:hypothetical protein [Archangium sp.]
MRTLLLALPLLTFLSCEKSKTDAAPTAPKKVKDDTAGKAEVEFFGTWSAGEVKAAKYIFVAQAEPCTPVPEKPTRYGEEKLAAPGPLFSEFYIPQGTVGHTCVYGLDETGKVVSAAGSTQNPMTFKGEGEVIFGKLDYALKAP